MNIIVAVCLVPVWGIFAIMLLWQARHASAPKRKAYGLLTLRRYSICMGILVALAGLTGSFPLLCASIAACALLVSFASVPWAWLGYTLKSNSNILPRDSFGGSIRTLNPYL